MPVQAAASPVVGAGIAAEDSLVVGIPVAFEADSLVVAADILVEADNPAPVAFRGTDRRACPAAFAAGIPAVEVDIPAAAGASVVAWAVPSAALVVVAAVVAVAVEAERPVPAAARGVAADPDRL